MARIQSNFTAGEVSPELYARVDFEGYYKGLKRAKNLTINLRGGLNRRFGTQFCGRINETDVVSEVKNHVFKIGQLSYYSIVLVPNRIDIYYERSQVASIDNPFARQDIKNVKFSQVGNDVFLLHERYETQFLSRSALEATAIIALGGSTNSLRTGRLPVNRDLIFPVQFATTGTLPDTSPVIDTSNTYFIRTLNGFDFSVYATPTDARLDINRFSIADAGSDSSLIILNSWALNNFEFKTQPTFDYAKDYFSSTFSFNSTGNVLTCSASVFRTEHVGGLFKFPFTVDIDRLIGRISAVNSGTEAVLEGDWTKSPSGMRGSDCFLNEVVFSTARGWAKTGVVYENRLFFGGNLTLPGNAWGSVTNNEEDFDDSDAADTSAIGLATSQNSGQILYASGNKSLILFTNSGIYATSVNTAQALTPSNRKITQVSSIGVEDVPPVEIDNQIFFVPKGGKSVKSMVFDINLNGYDIVNISKLSNHLIKSPRSACSLVSSSQRDVSFILYVNEDGTMACLTVQQEEGIFGWTEIITEGSFRYVSSLDGKVYAIIERTISEGTELFVEYLDFDFLLDSGFKKTYSSPVSEVAGLNHLEGKTVKVIADGYIYDYVVQNSSVELETPATNIEVGLNFQPEISPLNYTEPDSGTYLYYNKQIKRLFVDYYQSFGIKVDGIPIPNLSFGNDAVDEPASLQTGVYRWSPRSSLSYDWDLSITQDEPYSFTLRALGYEVT